MIIAILGRQPKIGLAELESLLGADKVTPIQDHAAFLHVDRLDHKRLGGSIRLAMSLTELDTTDWTKLAAYTARELPKHVCCLVPGKLKLGLSTFGLNVTTQQLVRSGLEFKKICRASGRSTRIIPNTAPALNSAQVLHNQLAGNPLGIELLYIKNGNKTWLARTLSVQDVDAYAKRDHSRPKRDARVGMLPPKLAQTIVNLATGPTRPEHGAVVLDPFCGTGVVLQEASLMGYDIYGSDIDPRMVEYTQANLLWLHEQSNHLVVHNASGTYFNLEIGDATHHKWAHRANFVASEVYLGQPLTAPPNPDKLREIMGNCNTITEKFLKNIYPQLPKGARLCLALPAWRAGNAFKHLPLLEHLSHLGYNRIRFQHAAWNDLLYHREDQVVARELLVLTKD